MPGGDTYGMQLRGSSRKPKLGGSLAEEQLEEQQGEGCQGCGALEHDPDGNRRVGAPVGGSEGKTRMEQMDEMDHAHNQGAERSLQRDSKRAAKLGSAQFCRSCTGATERRKNV